MNPFYKGLKLTRGDFIKLTGLSVASLLVPATGLPLGLNDLSLFSANDYKTKVAILNANYLLACLKDHYKILYTGKNGTCAHELILDCNEFHKTAGVEVISIAKRLMDYGFHAPTVAFPVHGTLMVEPTESEPLGELDRFVEAMTEIRREIREIIDGKADPASNVLKNAPHTAAMVMNSRWEYPYSREKAATTVPMETKYWPPVTHIDDAYGDRNLMCTCEP